MRPSQMVTDQMEGGRVATEALPDGQMAAETPPVRPEPPRKAPPRPQAVSAAFGTGTGAAIVFRDLASI